MRLTPGPRSRICDERIQHCSDAEEEGEHTMKRKPIVIAVAAIAGGGKTTLVLEAAKALDAAVLMFDDYFRDYPVDMAKWLQDGADLSTWKSPQLASELRKLVSWQPVRSRRDGPMVEPKPVIMLEEPTGRQRPEMAELIDFVVAIDTPLEVGLARLVKRTLGHLDVAELHSLPREDIIQRLAGPLAFLQGYLRSYPDTGRLLYAEILDQVMGNCDLILDWRLPIEKQIRTMADRFGLELSQESRERAAADHRQLAILHALSGRSEEARAEAAELLKQDPAFTVEEWGKDYTRYRGREVAERDMDALRKAGLK